MEREAKLHQLQVDREAFIKSVYAEKKGREVNGKNPFTCYVAINSPKPSLPLLTASLLEELAAHPYEAYYWTLRWDKSVISVSPGSIQGCMLLHEDDPRAKAYVPVSTTKPINSTQLIQDMPPGNLGIICINDQPMTVDSFLITYFHMVNELAWDIARLNQDGKVDIKSYTSAVDAITSEGFSIQLMPEEEIILKKLNDPTTSVRIYGSKVNPFVPEIMGAIMKP